MTGTAVHAEQPPALLGAAATQFGIAGQRLAQAHQATTDASQWAFGIGVEGVFKRLQITARRIVEMQSDLATAQRILTEQQTAATAAPGQDNTASVVALFAPIPAAVQPVIESTNAVCSSIRDQIGYVGHTLDASGRASPITQPLGLALRQLRDFALPRTTTAITIAAEFVAGVTNLPATSR